MNDIEAINPNIKYHRIELSLEVQNIKILIIHRVLNYRIGPVKPINLFLNVILSRHLDG